MLALPLSTVLDPVVDPFFISSRWKIPEQVHLTYYMENRFASLRIHISSTNLCIFTHASWLLRFTLAFPAMQKSAWAQKQTTTLFGRFCLQMDQLLLWWANLYRLIQRCGLSMLPLVNFFSTIKLCMETNLEASSKWVARRLPSSTSLSN